MLSKKLLKSKLIFKEYYLIVFLAVLYSVINIGNYKLGIAQTSSDDGIISYAFMVKNPENYVRDAAAQSLKVMGSNSILYQITGWLYVTFGLNPEVNWVFLVYFQNIFYVIAIYYLARCMELTKILSIVAVIMAINLRIHTLNLSWIGDLEWMPYGTWIVLPIELICIGLIIQLKFKFAVFLHSICILMHPTFSLGVTMLILVYSLTERKRIKGVNSVLFLIFPYFYLGFNYLKNRDLFLENIDDSIIQSILANSHVNTLLFNENNLNFDITVVSSFTLSSFLYLVTYSLKNDILKDKKIKPIIIFTTFILILFIIINFLGIFFQVVPVLQLNLHRFSIIYILIIFLFSIKILAYSNNAIIKYFVSILYFFIFVTSNLFIHVFISIYWMLFGLNKNRLILIQSQVTLFFQLWILNKIKLNENLNLIDTIKSVGTNLNWESVLSAKYDGYLILILISALWFIFYGRLWPSADKKKKIVEFLAYFIMIFFAYIVLEYRWLDTLNRENAQLKAYADIQKWAREKSEPEDYFMVDNLYIYRGWRNATNRPVLSYMNIGNSYAYLKSDKYWSDTYAEFFLKNEPYAAEGKVDETKSVESFGLKFGASYVVWKKEWKQLDLPIVYSNEYYIIYSLKK